MRIFLAPMEGVIDHRFRTIYSEVGGIDVCVSEFVRVNDLPITQKTFLRDCPELKGPGHSTTPNGTPVRIQLLGSNPETMAESARLAAELGASAIDLNFGCPAKTVNNSKGGAILLKEPDLVGSIVHAVRAAVPAPTPVTAKIRLGFEERNLYLANAEAIAAAGASELAVHARSRADGYKPPAYWHCISEIVDRVQIPVIANGEIWNAQDWLRCRDASGCEDVMLGRGAMACPDLGAQIRACASGTPYSPLEWPDVLQLLYRFYLETRDVYPVRFLGNRVKQWLFYLQWHFPEAVTFFEQIKRFKQAEQFELAFSSGKIPGRLLRNL